MDRTSRYPGIHSDLYGGMTDVGRVIRDAWALGVLPEAETCEGWTPGQLQALYDKVYAAWEPYGHMPSLLPSEVKENFMRIQEEAVRVAREKGWQPPMESDGN